MTGAEEFRIEGREESKVEVARNMIKMGTETAFILKVTGLTRKQFEEIKSYMD